ncbi:hypothetical protein BC567DRAFT_77600 [Phyllosticta citribraziliensis]
MVPRSQCISRIAAWSGQSILFCPPSLQLPQHLRTHRHTPWQNFPSAVGTNHCLDSLDGAPCAGTVLAAEGAHTSFCFRIGKPRPTETNVAAIISRHTQWCKNSLLNSQGVGGRLLLSQPWTPFRAQLRRGRRWRRRRRQFPDRDGSKTSRIHLV